MYINKIDAPKQKRELKITILIQEAEECNEASEAANVEDADDAAGMLVLKFNRKNGRKELRRMH